jgi:glucosamine 6-phosphate synthetase-like amidotransferase/phosphosugar isomerase protein
MPTECKEMAIGEDPVSFLQTEIRQQPQVLMTLLDREIEDSHFVAIVPSQLFALHLTLTKGHDPDQPQGIQKVTLTR